MAGKESVAFWTCKEAAHYLRLSMNGFYKMMHSKNGPPVIKLSHHTTLVPKNEFLQWVESKRLNGEKRA